MKIEQKVIIEAPLANVWDAIIDHEKFGRWFHCKLDQPFEEGQPSTGMMTYPGYEHVKWEAKVIAIEHEKSIEFSWPGYVDGESVDLSQSPWLRGKFVVEATADGTLLTITESGFDKLPSAVAEKAFGQCKQGWEIQAENIKEYVMGQLKG